ncbi:INSulin related [Caenorhabditis elegans]|uniref:INSulin related n=1 Tax=Caenorhabditis elegans TaxID=6239 RepID=Q9XUI8_CAEEL|nr:INSulin related [Caenorhabditis elegans]CAB04963.1 INSulin related [Caenorhabditis elegans]|eukprot:NP_493444.1 INSulin related [Caenorhabditis elegans]
MSSHALVLFLLLFLLPVALGHFLSKPAPDPRITFNRKLAETLKELQDMGLIQAPREPVVAAQGAKKTCGRSLLIKIQQLCHGICTVHADDLHETACMKGLTDSQLINSCCPPIPQTPFVF